MQATRIAMGRGSISTSHGQSRILKHATPDLLTYIQRAVKSGVYRTTDEIFDMNQQLMENPSDLRRIRWNVQRGSKIHDYPKEYEILSLNPPPPFKPRIPVKDRRKMYNRYVKSNRPMDRLAQNYLNKQRHGIKNSGDELTADEYYRRLLGSHKILKADSAMSSQSATVRKAYAVAVKQYEVMRTSNLCEKEAMEKVEELLANDDFEEKTTSRTKAEALQTNSKLASTKKEDIIGRGEAAFDGAKSKEEILESTDDISNDYGTQISMLYSDKQRSFEGMINWTKRLQAVPYNKWTVGASVALDHWIALRVLGLSEETWLALLEGNSPELMGRGRDIVVARHALFPETMIESNTYDNSANDGNMIDDTEDDLETLLATLSGWNSPDTSTSTIQPSVQKNNDSFSSEEFTEKLQIWRTKQVDKDYHEWTLGEKQEFMLWLEAFVSAQIPETSLNRVDLEETRNNILGTPPQEEKQTNEFWVHIKDETNAELFLQSLLAERKEDDDHPFWDLDYQTQLERLVNLGTIGEIANEYTTEVDRSKFLTRYGDYILEGVQFDHLISDPSGIIMGSDLGRHLQEKYKISPADRFSLKKLSYGTNNFDSRASRNARSLYMEWNKLKVGRAHYEEKLYKKGLLGLTYDKSQSQK